jgi:hypothetical protein
MCTVGGGRDHASQTGLDERDSHACTATCVARACVVTQGNSGKPAHNK